MLRLWLSDFDSIFQNRSRSQFDFEFYHAHLSSFQGIDTDKRRPRAIEAILSAMQCDTVAPVTASTGNAIQWAASLSIRSKLDHAAATQQTNSYPLRCERYVRQRGA